MTEKKTLKKIPPDKRLIVALDVQTSEEAAIYVRHLWPTVTNYKIGLELFISEGSEAVKKVKGGRGEVFLDLKFFDIPNTMAAAVNVSLALKPFMITVHALAGPSAMKECVKAARKIKSTAKLLAVTILTSFDSSELRKSQIAGPVEKTVLRLAASAIDAGMDGVVASPREVPKLRKKFGDKILIVTPGIRPKWAKKNDQKRAATPYQAIKNGADYIVVGRPIVQSSDPAKAAKMVIDEIEKGLS